MEKATLKVNARKKIIRTIYKRFHCLVDIDIYYSVFFLRIYNNSVKKS